MYIGDMHLNHWCRDGFDCIPQGDRGMRVGSCIQDDAIVFETNLLHLVNQFPFDIALKIGDLTIRITHFQPIQITFERGIAINRRLTLPQ